MATAPTDNVGNIQSPDAASPSDDLQELTYDAFLKVGEYLGGELEGSIEDYTMLEKMNKVMSARYCNMRTQASDVNDSMQHLKSKYEAVQQHIDQISEIEQAVNSLEKAAYSLDAYSKQLESKFKELEKR